MDRLQNQPLVQVLPVNNRYQIPDSAPAPPSAKVVQPEPISNPPNVSVPSSVPSSSFNGFDNYDISQVNSSIPQANNTEQSAQFQQNNQPPQPSSVQPQYPQQYSQIPDQQRYSQTPAQLPSNNQFEGQQVTPQSNIPQPSSVHPQYPQQYSQIPDQQFNQYQQYPQQPNLQATPNTNVNYEKESNPQSLTQNPQYSAYPQGSVQGIPQYTSQGYPQGSVQFPPQYPGQQAYPSQNYPVQGHPPQGYPQPGTQGYTVQNQQGYPPQGYQIPPGYPPQGVGMQGYPQGYPPQDLGSYSVPPQGYGVGIAPLVTVPPAQQSVANSNNAAIQGYLDILKHDSVILLRNVASGKYVQIDEKGLVNSKGEPQMQTIKFRVIRLPGQALCKLQSLQNSTRWLKVREGGHTCCEVSQNGTLDTEMRITKVTDTYYTFANHNRKNHYLGFNRKGETYPVFDPTALLQMRKSRFEIIPVS